MANLRGDDRSQIILVAAFLLAITFVVLALVVNSAIFTENLATRDDVAGSHDALDHRSEVQANAGDLLTGVNQNSTLGESELEAAIENNLSLAGGLQQSTQGRLVNVSYEDGEAVPGTKIAQDNSSRNFTSAGGDRDWNVTNEHVESIRNFHINVSEPDVSIGQFAVIVNDTDTADEEWRMEIDRNNGYLNVTVDGANLDEKECAREFDSYMHIDVTGATVDGEPCIALGQLQDPDGTKQWIAGTIEEGDSYRIKFEDANDLEGTYSFIIGEEGDIYSPPPGETKLEDNQQADEPYAVDAIYSIILSYEYYTSAVGYETEIRVAPGEVPP